MQIGATSFEGFRALCVEPEISARIWNNSDSARSIPKKPAAKPRRRKFSRHYSVNLLANDAGIIFRQSKASLMLLF
jgi:hypothetical protein